MDDNEAGLIEPDQPTQADVAQPLLEEARQIEREMYQVMTTQVKLAAVQIAIGLISIAIALVVGLLLR